ncbi:MAG: HAMP domain-containing sensor histidine kinase [Patescibacteria group bacterium]|jgi:signal transduction histidine kinase
MAKNPKAKTAVGDSGYLNKNCWLVKNLNYSPYRRCQHCDFKFRNCLFLHYQVISIILIILALGAFLIVEGKISTLVVIAIFTLVIVYGYFFNQSTEKIIISSFSERQAKVALQELTGKLAEKVDEQTKYLKELLEMKSDFLRVVNHQLNTPLSVMKGYFSMAEENSYPMKKALPPIKAGLERISSTVADFWNAYELEGEKMQMNPEKTDLLAIATNLIPEKKKMQLAVERKLALEVKKPAFPMPLVWCDYKKTAHVVSNLLDNAIYYTRQGKVTVDFELLGKDYLKVNVKDTGVGISPADKKKLFQKFSRGESATDLRPDGSGLGLFIAKKIVEGNDGEIACASAGAGKGSTFSFTVPIYKNQKLTRSAEKSANREQKIVIFDKK